MMAQCVSILFIAGHFTLFSYLTSYAASKGFFGPHWEAFLYAVFGSSGMAGGVLAGILSDLAGRRLALVASPAIYLVTTLLLCVSESSIFFSPAFQFGDARAGRFRRSSRAILRISAEARATL
ncbi:MULTISPECIES: MFS transporter [Rhizobium]|uniref:MFS transporter n=2 Tax=Rhizobium/Agrobacterium group TaxID=227290 RepID=UPI001611B53C|nr:MULTISPECIES: MFS transporter [Rhizobium]MBB6304917.1 putative MFS family arabinose efflux permease [Rhizobium leucaenae]MDK4743337.1 MFS transporter [Rhizobium sp. CNPSo 3464]